MAETKLTFEDALKIVSSMEAATKSAVELQAGEKSQQQVHKVESSDIKDQTSRPPFYRRGKKDHPSNRCRFLRAVCNNCGKVGHIQRICRSPQQGQLPKRQRKLPAPSRKTQQQIKTVTSTSDKDSEYQLHNLSTQKADPIMVTLSVEGKDLQMEVDTGAAVSLVPFEIYQQLCPEKELLLSSLELRTYSGEQIKPVGCQEVQVRYGDQSATVNLIVVEGKGPNLFGRDWLQVFKVDWASLYNVKSEEGQVQSILKKHEAVFKEGLGTLTGYKAKIHIDPTATQKYFKARSVPYAMKSKIEDELDRLQKEGIIEPVTFSEWAAPIVPVLKADKSVRICSDFKVTVNPVSKLDRYPIPKIEDLLATLAKGKYFSKLDMSRAYLQLELEEESKKFMVINTHRGLYRYNRLPFGIASAPGIFQRVMENLVQGIPVYLDDILITGATDKDHLKSLGEVLHRFEEAGLRLRKDKCVFKDSSVTYLGHRIDAEGVHPTPEKIKAIERAPSPSNVTQLKSYLGLLTYYNRFLPNLTSILFPLYRLLKKNARWHWTQREEESFQASKKLLTSAEVLVHFDPNLELLLSCDASAYGVGAVLAHRLPDGSERPIGYVSRTLSDAERNYSQMKKDGLACIFGVKKFHSYLFGHPLTLYTDHLPLKSLFNEHHCVPTQASGGIQRSALILSSYENSIAFRPTYKHNNADAMSRLPMPEAPGEVPIP